MLYYTWQAKYHSGLLISHTVPGDVSSRALYSIYLGVHTVPSYQSSRGLVTRVLEVYLGVSIHHCHIELNPDHVHQRREAEHHVSTLWPEGGGSPVDSDGGISSGHQWGLGTWSLKQYGRSKAALGCVGGYICMYGVYICVCVRVCACVSMWACVCVCVCVGVWQSKLYLQSCMYMHVYISLTNE